MLTVSIQSVLVILVILLLFVLAGAIIATGVWFVKKIISKKSSSFNQKGE